VAPFIIGGALGVPIGAMMLLTYVNPAYLRTAALSLVPIGMRSGNRLSRRPRRRQALGAAPQAPPGAPVLLVPDRLTGECRQA
jgi:hypothetical protein